MSTVIQIKLAMRVQSEKSIFLSSCSWFVVVVQVRVALGSELRQRVQLYLDLHRELSDHKIELINVN